ncbi:Uncharacterised protein [Streptococcus pneumoniae]|nr:Uncharacterised protein [Streptococcus pneumoniae]
MPDFMNQGIDIAQTACPAHEYIRVYAIWVRRITTGILATVSSKVHPALFLVTSNFLTIFLPQRFYRLHDQIIGIVNSHFRIEGAVQVQFPVCKGHLFKTIYLGNMLEVSLSDWCKVLHDEVNLAVKHDTVHFLFS